MPHIRSFAVLLALLLSLSLLLTGCQMPAEGKNEPEPPSQPEVPLSDGTSPDPGSTGEPEEDGGSEEAEEPEEDGEPEEPFAVDFSDAAFLGDSRTEGLQIHTGLSKADFFTGVGLMVNEARTEQKILLPDGTKGTALDALASRQYRRIYLMFGINELGWPDADLFRDAYVDLLRDIQDQQPDAEIYVQTIFPVTRAKSESDKIYNNANVVRFNERIREAAELTEVHLVDTALLFDDGEGNLPEEASVDGVHLSHDYYLLWLEHLREAV